MASDTAPEFTNLPRSVTIYPDVTSETLLYTIQVDDIDPYDVPILAISAEYDSFLPFYYDRTNRRYPESYVIRVFIPLPSLFWWLCNKSGKYQFSLNHYRRRYGN